MANSASTILLLLIVGVIIFLYIKRKKPAPSAGAPTTTATTSGDAGTGGTITAKQIYKGTGKIISGAGFYTNASQTQALASGGTRPSVRYGIWTSHHSTPPCVPFQNTENTVYVKIGPKTSSHGNEKCTVGTGGPGQSDGYCCVYHIGFTGEGATFAEEEGAHDPKPTLEPITSQNKIPGINIGPVANRTLGLKTIFWRIPGQTHCEGWVDKSANGQWVKHFSADNAHGSGAGLPVITKMPMGGSGADNMCQEMRFRLDNHWPVDLIRPQSGIIELVMPVQPNAGAAMATIIPRPSIANDPRFAEHAGIMNMRKNKINFAHISNIL